MALTAGQWATLEPPVEACRPHAKVPPSNLRRTVEAIVRRCRNGARWRAVPAEPGPWWMAAQTFIRWARLGVRDRPLAAAQARGVELGLVFLDGTSVRAHAKAAGASKRGGSGAGRDRREALGRSRGGYGTKAVVIADGHGRAVAFDLAPGQAHELPLAPGLLARLPGRPLWVVADRGYSSHAFRDRAWSLGARPAIPPKRNGEQVACPDYVHVNRNRVERLWGRLKEWRAAATRHEKTARSFLGVLCLAASMDWIRR